MSRLTCKYDVDNVLRDMCTFDRESNVEADDCLTCFEYCNNKDMNCEKCAIQKAFDKLADYEDLEEQGLLLKLPCKVGTVAYLIDHNSIRLERKPFKCIIDEFTVDRYNDCYAVLNGVENFYMMRRFRAINIKQFGKTIFLIKKDAEKAIERLEKENE